MEKFPSVGSEPSMLADEVTRSNDTVTTDSHLIQDGEFRAA